MPHPARRILAAAILAALALPATEAAANDAARIRDARADAYITGLARLCGHLPRADHEALLEDLRDAALATRPATDRPFAAAIINAQAEGLRDAIRRRHGANCAEIRLVLPLIRDRAERDTGWQPAD